MMMMLSMVVDEGKRRTLALFSVQNEKSSMLTSESCLGELYNTHIKMLWAWARERGQERQRWREGKRGSRLNDGGDVGEGWQSRESVEDDFPCSYAIHWGWCGVRGMHTTKQAENDTIDKAKQKITMTRSKETLPSHLDVSHTKTRNRTLDMHIIIPLWLGIFSLTFLYTKTNKVRVFVCVSVCVLFSTCTREKA